MVTTQIAGKAPLLGPYLTRLMGGGGTVGVVTFARFYGLHVLLLPPLIGILIALHVYLVRRHGVAPAPGNTGPMKKFFPEQVMKDVIAMFAAFVILFIPAAAVDVPLGHLADPTDISFVPRPDWYYLFLFQILKAFKGGLEPIGSVVLPALAVLVLFLVPFVDRGRVTRLTQRTVAFGCVVLVAAGWTALTVAAVRATPKQAAAQAASVSPAADWRQLSPEELAGLGYFRQEACALCHNLDSGPPKPGPNLASVGARKSAAWMIQHFKNPPRVIPGSNMPPIDLSDAQLNTLAAFLLKLTPDNARALAAAPGYAVRGAQIYQANGCAGCHQVNGSGRSVGPPLKGVARRHPKEWIEKHFADPPALSPGSIMPPFQFPPRDLEAITSYLMAL